MTRVPSAPASNAVDKVVSHALDNSFTNISRRSFLSLLTRKLIGLTGVAVAAEVFPYFVPRAEALVPTDCGLHGWICTSGTPCNGGVVGNKWVQCCQVPVPCDWKYKCVSYVDYCGTRPGNWPNGCVGNFIDDAISWCGGAGGPNAEYICTKKIVHAPIYGTFAQCQSNCGSALIECTLG